jgi:hypothetical protein
VKTQRGGTTATSAGVRGWDERGRWAFVGSTNEEASWADKRLLGRCSTEGEGGRLDC